MKKMKLLYALILSSIGMLGYAATPTEGELVDLGLSVKWRGCNIGATTPSETGGLYAFACTQTGSYDRMTYPFFNWDYYIINIPTTNIAATKYDAAFTTTDGLWRMPSTEEWEELFSGCNCETTTLGSVEGVLFTSKKNGNSIFLPKISDPNGRPRDTMFSYYSSVAASSKEANVTQCYGTPEIVESATPFNACPIRPVYNASEAKVESITLSAEKTTVYAGTTLTISAKVTPEDAPIAKGTWSSSNPEVASVTKGVVKGLKAGTTTIKLECDGVEGKIDIKVEAVETVVVDGYVDLGLSVMWAEKNLGANAASEVGSLYPWGYITPDVIDDFLKYKFFNQFSYQYVLPLTDICGNKAYDAVAADSNGKTQLPSKAQAEELIANCDYEAGALNGVKGTFFISRVNGQRIFLPKTNLYWLGTAEDSKSAAYGIDLDTDFKDTPGVRTYSQCFKQFPLRGIRYNDNVKLESIEIVGGDRTVYTENNFYLSVAATPTSYEIKEVEWSSSAPSVARVLNQQGLVWVQKAGSCVITATVEGVSASITLTVKDIDVTNSESGVHMGNNLYWTTHDLGVSEPYERGTLYYFGSATPGVMPSTYPDNILGTDLDPAKKELKGDWHIPTSAEWEWLIANTDMEWLTWKGREGALLTSKITGEQLYFTWNTFGQTIQYFAAETMPNHTSINVYRAMENQQTMGGVSANTSLPVRAVRTFDPSQSGLNEVSYDDKPADVYTVSGVQVLKNASAAEIKSLPSGLYIVRTSGKTIKLLK